MHEILQAPSKAEHVGSSGAVCDSALQFVMDPSRQTRLPQNNCGRMDTLLLSVYGKSRSRTDLTRTRLGAVVSAVVHAAIAGAALFAWRIGSEPPKPRLYTPVTLTWQRSTSPRAPHRTVHSGASRPAPEAAPPRPSPPPGRVVTGLLDAPAIPIVPAQDTKGIVLNVLGTGNRARPTSGPIGTSQTIRVGGVFGDGTGFEGGDSSNINAPTTPPPVADRPAELVSEPKPFYTEEARRLQVEGDVLLDIDLTVGGTVRIVQIVAGLEAGLTEAAIDAVKKITYRPALKGGRHVNEFRRIRVVFKLTRDTR